MGERSVCLLTMSGLVVQREEFEGNIHKERAFLHINVQEEVMVERHEALCSLIVGDSEQHVEAGIIYQGDFSQVVSGQFLVRTLLVVDGEDAESGESSELAQVVWSGMAVIDGMTRIEDGEPDEASCLVLAAKILESEES